MSTKLLLHPKIEEHPLFQISKEGKTLLSSKYVGDNPHNQFVDISLCDPYHFLFLLILLFIKTFTFEQFNRNAKIESLLKDI